MTRGIADESLDIRLARLAASIYRFSGLRIAKRAFARVPEGTVLSRRFFQHNLYVDVSRTDTHRLLYLEGERFVTERVLIAELVNSGDHVIDVGANIGYYAIMFASLVGREGSVLCIEPEPDNLIELKRNVTGNKLTNVEILGAAAGEKVGRVSFSRGINGRVASELNGHLDVDMVLLDSLVYDKIDLIKIDVEGYEGQVLAGAQRILADLHPNLFVEVHPDLLIGYSTNEVIDLVRHRYNHIRYYDPNIRGAAKVTSRYGSRPFPAVLCERALSSRADVFWMVCTN
jgi:FkbM family methyltransferase